MPKYRVHILVKNIEHVSHTTIIQDSSKRAIAREMIDIDGHTSWEWADAIATRITDGWRRSDEDPEDVRLLESVLRNMLERCPDACRRLIGTGIIEEGYFDPLG